MSLVKVGCDRQIILVLIEIILRRIGETVWLLRIPSACFFMMYSSKPWGRWGQEENGSQAMPTESTTREAYYSEKHETQTYTNIGNYNAGRLSAGLRFAPPGAFRAGGALEETN